MSEEKSRFTTIKVNKSANGLSPVLEDYLEMIARLSKKNEAVRIKDLAGSLSVTPSAATRMAAQLRDGEYIRFERYGSIRLTEKGEKAGGYFLRRHSVLERFLMMLNNSSEELLQVEGIEHFINETTVFNIEKLLKAAENEEKPNN